MSLTVLAVLVGLGASPVVQHVVKGATAPTYRLDQGSAQLLLNATTGAKEAALTLLQLQPGARVPEHTHPESAEVLYIQTGEVEMVIGGAPLRAGQGDAVYIPAGVAHSAKVHGSAVVTAVQLYVGPGPEQRFTRGERLR